MWAAISCSNSAGRVTRPEPGQLTGPGHSVHTEHELLNALPLQYVKPHLEVSDELLKVVQLEQLRLALRNHRQRRLRQKNIYT